MKNKLILIDDIHFEGRPDEDRHRFFLEIEDCILRLRNSGYYPIVVLAGDIDVGVNGIHWASQFSTDVVYVPGNHEYWGYDIFTLDDEIQSVIRDNGYEHVHCLQNSHVEINGLRFIGSTLWTDLGGALYGDSENQTIRSYHVLGDFKRIFARSWYDSKSNISSLRSFGKKQGWSEKQVQSFIDQGLFNPLIELDLNRRNIEFLFSSLNDGFQGQSVVVTHHLPLYKSWLTTKGLPLDTVRRVDCTDFSLTQKAFRGADIALKELVMMGFYANNATFLFDDTSNPPLFWLHGHLHMKSNVMGNVSKVCSSPVGYYSQSSDLTHLVLDVGEGIKEDIISLIGSYEWEEKMIRNLSLIQKTLTHYRQNPRPTLADVEYVNELFRYFSYRHEKNRATLSQRICYWLQILVFHTQGQLIHADEYMIEKYTGLKGLYGSELGCFATLSIQVTRHTTSHQLEAWLSQIQMMMDYTRMLKGRLSRFVLNYKTVS